MDLSAADGTLNIPLKDLVLTYQRTSASALRINIAPKDAAAPVLTDIRRTTIYDGSTVEAQTLNGSTLLFSVDERGTPLCVFSAAACFFPALPLYFVGKDFTAGAGEGKP